LVSRKKEAAKLVLVCKGYLAPL